MRFIFSQDDRRSSPRSDVSVSAALPANPTVFHGRKSVVDNAVQLLIAPVAARVAVLGPGGIGKTSVALALLHNPHVAQEFGGQRFFLSCEALLDADSIVVSLAKLLQLPVSGDLLSAVLARFERGLRALLVLDNLETVWLAGGTPALAVDELLGRFAQLTTLTLMITCRGTDLPQFVKWSNNGAPVLEPFSLDAALQTFEDKAGHQISDEDLDIAKELLNAVDRMPLAVSLLGQLARRGNSVPELLIRWDREHTLLLRTHGAGRINNVDVSVRLSTSILDAADYSKESLKLLSLCCMLPDGLRRNVFEKLRPHFECIDHARDNLFAYSLASLGADGMLRTLSPIRYHILRCHPPLPQHRKALCLLYCDIAEQLPITMDDSFKKRAADNAPEIGNLSSLLLQMVNQPSEEIVSAVVRFTNFTYWQLPSATIASALLPYLEPNSEWKARCLSAIGNTQIRLAQFRSALDTLSAAAMLFLEVGKLYMAAWCTQLVAEALYQLGDYEQAEPLLNEAQEAYARSGDEFGTATCRMKLGNLMRMKANYPTAIEHYCAARDAFNGLSMMFHASQCSEALGMVYLHQSSLESAAGELQAAHSAFISLGALSHAAQSALLLSIASHEQGEVVKAEDLLDEAKTIYGDICDRLGLANCALQSGSLKSGRGHLTEGLERFEYAHRLYVELQMPRDAQKCRELIERLALTAIETAGIPRGFPLHVIVAEGCTYHFVCSDREQ